MSTQKQHQCMLNDTARVDSSAKLFLPSAIDTRIVTGENGVMNEVALLDAALSHRVKGAAPLQAVRILLHASINGALVASKFKTLGSRLGKPRCCRGFSSQRWCPLLELAWNEGDTHEPCPTLTAARSSRLWKRCGDLLVESSSSESQNEPRTIAVPAERCERWPLDA